MEIIYVVIVSVVANVGVSLNSSITSYYDAIGVAKAGWEGTW